MLNRTALGMAGAGGDRGRFASKQWVMNNMMLHETQPLMPFLNLFYAHNYGAAFSSADKGGWQRWFFAGIAIAIVVSLLVMMYRNRASNKLTNIAYALIIGGALGNLFDRAARLCGRLYRLLCR